MSAIDVTTYLSMFARRCCYAAILLSCLQTPILAQEPARTAKADAPIYRIGDTWTFIFGKTAVRESVVSVSANRTTLSKTHKGAPPSELEFDDHGCVTRTDRTTYEPNQESLSFPMTIGKTWDAHWVVRDTTGAHETDAHVRVEGFERIQVEAGSFDAFKIIMRGVSAWNERTLQQAPWVATYWYAPSVKRVIKSEYEIYLFHRTHTDTFELSEFSLAP